MSKQKKISEKIEKVEEVKQEITIPESFEILDELFRVEEDNYNEQQDERLLNLIENDNRFNDKIKIQWLFKRYRDTARDLHNC